MLSNIMIKRKWSEHEQEKEKEKQHCKQVPYSYIQSLIQTQDWIDQNYSCSGSVYTEQEAHLF